MARSPAQRDAYGRPMPQGQGFIKGADVYRTDDGGKTWRQTSRYDQATTKYLNEPLGHLRLGVRPDPRRSDEREHDLHPGRAAQHLDATAARRSRRVGGMHGDHHGLWIDPANTNIIYNANDGGFYQTADGGKTWKFAVAAAGAQFYNVELDTSTPFWAYGSIQDHGSRRGRSIISNGRGAARRRWRSRTRPAARAPITRSIRPTRTSSTRTASTATSAARISARRRRPAGRGRGRRRRSDADPADGSGRRAARAVDGAVHHLAARQQHRLRGLSSSLFRSQNRGDAWEKISPRPDRQQHARRWARTRRPFPTRRSSRSPSRRGRRTCSTSAPTTAGCTRRSTAARNGRSSRRSCRCAAGSRALVPSMHAEGTVYVTQRGREDDDFAAYIYKSTDYGRTFRVIANNIPAGPGERDSRGSAQPERPLRRHRLRRVRLDQRRRPWEVLGGNLPSVQVSDLQFQRARQHLVISTYGRGIWVFDAIADSDGEDRDVVDAAPADDPLWYKDAVIYQVHVRGFFDSNDDGVGDFRGPDAQARLHPVARRQRHLAAAVLPVAAARRRLRHRALRGRAQELRHAEGLPDVPRRGARARPARHHRARHQPHVRPAPVVPGGAAGAARDRRKRDFYVWSDTDQKYAGVRIIFSDTERSNWAWDPVAGAVLLAPVLLTISRI